ncbi:hypothetical protein MARINON1_40256 [Marinobacter salarius]|nr:hypothetical protein MBHK15_70117 [Marinobacter salarius]VXB23365.1 hypothetical protein MARINON1_40256 [Marinobacter salarius]
MYLNFCVNSDRYGLCSVGVAVEFGHRNVIQALEVVLVFDVVNSEGGQFVGVTSCS